MKPMEMSQFLSDTNLSMHRAHLNTLVNLQSVYYKSIPELCGKNIYEIQKASFRKVDKSEFLPLFKSILLHKLYFSSFTTCPTKCKEIRRYYSSEEDLLFRSFEIAKECYDSFLCFYIDRNGRILFKTISLDNTYLDIHPILAVDLFEHSYFMDYGFERARYIKKALSYLNLDLISRSLKNKKLDIKV